jgi:hypothetical protein
MKKITIIIGVLIFGLWGCSKDLILDPSNGNSQSQKKAEIVTYELKAVKLQNHPTANPMVYRISGNISHMGLIDPASTLTITAMWPNMADPQPGPDGNPTNFFQTCEINMIGADGSAIYFVTSKPAPFSFATGYGEQDWTITSGTGRFEGAIGWYESTSQFDFATGINYVMGDGEIFITK